MIALHRCNQTMLPLLLLLTCCTLSIVTAVKTLNIKEEWQDYDPFTSTKAPTVMMMMYKQRYSMLMDNNHSMSKGSKVESTSLMSFKGGTNLSHKKHHMNKKEMNESNKSLTGQSSKSKTKGSIKSLKSSKKKDSMKNSMKKVSMKSFRSKGKGEGKGKGHGNAPSTSPTPTTMNPTVIFPSINPTRSPVTPNPNQQPTPNPTLRPTPLPTSRPTSTPTRVPTVVPTFTPTSAPTTDPTTGPTSTPTLPPTIPEEPPFFCFDVDDDTCGPGVWPKIPIEGNECGGDRNSPIAISSMDMCEPVDYIFSVRQYS